VRPDVSHSVRIVASSVSASRANGRAEDWNEEDAEEIRKVRNRLFCAIFHTKNRTFAKTGSGPT
jgi:hypothetical protein